MNNSEEIKLLREEIALLRERVAVLEAQKSITAPVYPPSIVFPRPPYESPFEYYKVTCEACQ